MSELRRYSRTLYDGMERANARSYLLNIGFSHEDRSTMEALTSALGRAPRFSVVAPDGMVVRSGVDEGVLSDEPWWAGLLRAASG